MQGLVLHPLIPFNMIYDTNIGIIKYLQSSFDTGYDDKFDINKLNDLGDRKLLSLLHSRTIENPLSILDWEDPGINMDIIYQDIMKKNKSAILRYSPFTDFGYAVIVYGSKQFDGINPHILVSCLEEKDKIQSVKELKEIPIETMKTLSPLVSKIDPYYAASYMDIFRLYEKFPDQLYGKNLYIVDDEFNHQYIMKHKQEDVFSKNSITAINLWRYDRYSEE